MGAKFLIVIVAASILLAINGQPAPEDKEITETETGEKTQKHEESSAENPPEAASVVAKDEIGATRPAIDTTEGTEVQPNAGNETASLEVSISQPTAQATTERETSNQVFILVPVPSNPFPNYFPVPPMYPGQPPSGPGQPQFVFNQPPMPPLIPMHHPMMFPPPPPPPLITAPGGNAPNGQPTAVMPVYYPQTNPTGPPQFVLLNHRTNPSDVVEGQSAVYFNKPNKNQEVIIIKSN